MLFLSCEKLFLFLRNLYFYPDLDYVEKWLDRKVKVNFKIYDVID